MESHLTSSETTTESQSTDSADELTEPVTAEMASSVNRSPGVEMGMSGDAIPAPEVEPEDRAEVNIYICRPVESHSGARETIIAGPYHNIIPYAPRSRRRRSREGGNMGEGCPLTIRLGVRGSAVTPPAGSGRKWMLCIFEVKKKPSGTPLSVFLSDGSPQRSRGPGKLLPSSLSTGLYICISSELSHTRPLL